MRKNHQGVHRARATCAFICFAAASVTAVSWGAGAPDADSAPAGYKTIVDTLGHQPPPAGWVGETETARKTIVGITPATLGMGRRFTLKYGSEVRVCPEVDGMAPGRGTFEFTFENSERVGNAIRTFQLNQHATATLKAHVNDDAWIDYAEIEIDFVQTQSATITPDSGLPSIEPPQTSRVRNTTRFTIPRSGFIGNVGATVGTVKEGKADSSTVIALLILKATESYQRANSMWRDFNRCVKIDYRPPTKATRLAPGETKTVIAELKTLEGSKVVPARFENGRAFDGGSVSPTDGRSAAGAPLNIQFKAQPRANGRAHFLYEAVSRAGRADEEWEADLGYTRLTVTQQVPDNVWQWRHCGTGVGPWKATSGNINVGTGEGEVGRDLAGWYEFKWTELGGIPVSIFERGKLKLIVKQAPDPQGRMVDVRELQFEATSVTGYWNLPKPLPRRPANPDEPPSPQGLLPVSAELLETECNPKNP